MAEGFSVAILGGYGQLGLTLARCLLRDGAGRVTLAGRDRDKAHRAVRALGPAGAVGLDARRVVSGDARGMADLLRDHDLLIHAAPLGTRLSEALVSALLEAGGRAMLVSHDAETIAKLRSARQSLVTAGATVILDAGADPGLHGLVGMLAARAHGAADAIEMTARYRAQRVGRAGLADLLDSAAGSGWMYDRGWRRAGLLRIRRERYPGAVGASLAMPVRLPELDALRERCVLQRLALWHGGLNGAADLVVLLRRLTGKLLPRQVLLSALAASMRYLNPPPYGLGIQATASGAGRMCRIELAHSNVYTATAEVAAVVAAMLADRDAATPGVAFAFELLAARDAVAVLSTRGFDLIGSTRNPDTAEWQVHDLRV